jgi:hypothetical protein
MPPEVTGAIEEQLRQQQASGGNFKEIEVTYMRFCTDASTDLDCCISCICYF